MLGRSVSAKSARLAAAPRSPASSARRKTSNRSNPHANTLVKAGDVVQLEGEADALHKLIADLRWTPHRAHHPLDHSREEVRSVEAVVGADSVLTGRSVSRVDLQTRFNVKLLAVARGGRRVTQRLRAAPIRAGDILMLRGSETDLSKAMTELGALPLADRAVQLGSRRPLVLPAVILAAAMVCVALKLLPVAIAFMIAAVLMVATRAISMREAYASLDGTVLVLIAALTPVSEALQKSGGADFIAANLSVVLLHAPPLAVLGLMMLTAMACAPFMHNAPTVLILGPVAIGVARHLHLGCADRPAADGCGDGGGLRFPHAGRPPMQHPGARPRRLPLQRLHRLGAPLVGAGDRGRHAADLGGLAARPRGDG